VPEDRHTPQCSLKFAFVNGFAVIVISSQKAALTIIELVSGTYTGVVFVPDVIVILPGTDVFVAVGVSAAFTALT
jgi:hypothetical protein